MNTKFFFVLLAVVLIATACAPAIVESVAPAEPAAPPADTGKSVSLPVTGNSLSAGADEAQAPRLWSGEVFLNSNAPDHEVQNERLNIQPSTEQMCTSEEGKSRRYGGCVE